MDPPAHLYADRTTLDQFPASQFIGKALVIDCRDLPEGGVITMDYLKKDGAMADEADFLLFNLGWDKYWGTPQYFGDYACVDDEVLNYIIDGNYKGIGFDVIGLDPIADENLKNLDQYGEGLFWFSCCPLKLENCDGSPIRAIAWFE